MKDYDISEKYKRIYQGILKWKQAGYKGLFQYTERIDIPLVISEVIQHVANQVEADPYVHIVVPDIKTKDSLRKRIVHTGVVIDLLKDFIDRITKTCKGKDMLYADTFVMLDCTNEAYHKDDTYFKKLKKVAADRFLFVTTKKIPVNMLKAFTACGIPVVDTITKGMALEEGWISPYVIYNVGIEFTSEEKELYKQLTEQISSMLSIFKGKAKMVNYEFRKFTHLRMDMVEDDMALIKACHMGVNYVNNLTDKVEHIHSETVCNMVAEVMGWKANLDLSNDYNKQVEMYWNPDNILTRTKTFSDAIEKRLELYNNNLNKREAIATDEVANVVFDVEGLTTIICTSPYCNPFKTISDKKEEQPYINKPTIIIWLYMQDFALNSDDYRTSKEKEKLIDAQSKFTTDIVWTNGIKDVKF